MSGRVVLLGAAGHTGSVTALALASAGVPVRLAARSKARLDELVGRLPDSGDVEVATVDVTRPDSVAELLNPGDVLVSTVGPFDTLGRPVLLAAIAAGVPYVDCCGESAFLRWVFETSEVAEAGVPLLTGYGFESVAGNVAAALALQETGAEAGAVDVFYVCDPRVASRGTLLSALSELNGCAVSRRQGRLQTTRVGGDSASVSAGGRVFHGLSITTTEPWTLPGTADVMTYLGGPRWRVRPLAGVLGAADLAGRLHAAEALMTRAMDATRRRVATRPAPAVPRTTQALVIARVLDAAGREIRRVMLGGADPYAFTASILTTASLALLDGAATASGPCGPVGAFGLPAALAAVEQAGMARIGEADESVLNRYRETPMKRSRL